MDATPHLRGVARLSRDQAGPPGHRVPGFRPRPLTLPSLWRSEKRLVGTRTIRGGLSDSAQSRGDRARRGWGRPRERATERVTTPGHTRLSDALPGWETVFGVRINGEAGGQGLSPVGSMRFSLLPRHGRWSRTQGRG